MCGTIGHVPATNQFAKINIKLFVDLFNKIYKHLNEPQTIYKSF